MHYPIQIGIKYLRSKKRATISVITVIAVIGVALGVGALLSVLSITAGFQEAFREKILGVNADALVLKYGVDFEEYRDVVEQAEAIPGVSAAAPFMINEMMLAKDSRLAGVLVKGVDPERMPKVLSLPSQLVQGDLKGLRLQGAQPASSKARKGMLDTAPETDLDRYLLELDSDHEKPKTAQSEENEKETFVLPNQYKSNIKIDVPSPDQVELALEKHQGLSLPTDDFDDALFSDNNDISSGHNLPGIVVGQALAEDLGLNVGDTVKVVSPLAGVDLSLMQQEAKMPKSRDFRVIAIFHAGFQEYDSNLVYVDLYETQALFDQGDVVTGVELKLHDIEQAVPIARELERRLDQGPYHTMSWQELNHNLFTALQMQKIVLTLVIATIIFVAAFNVIATLIMVVLEKKREVAILKAMGAKNRSILQIFLVQGAVIGALGTAIGLCLGAMVCVYLSEFKFPLDAKVYLIDHLPIRIDPMDFVVTAVVALLICVGATLLPSLWAARLLPVDGLRYE